MYNYNILIRISNIEKDRNWKGMKFLVSKINIITINDKKYPPKLKIIKNPPIKLYTIGNVELLNENSISIIGSRNCSKKGGKLAEKFAFELTNQGLAIVSGMAKGIDRKAHIGAIESNGKTIAVLGCGFNHIYPEENIDLYYEIIAKGGLVISEYSPETKADSKKFLERNRIVSGLSIGVLVIEAAHRSGTSITAKIAQKQGRKVFVLPHEIDDKHGVGTNRLIQKGANLITSTKQIIDHFDFLEYKEFTKSLENIKNIEKIEKNKSKTYQIEFENKEQELIFNNLGQEGSNINELYKKIKIPISKISENLLIMEINGYIEKYQGGYRCTKNRN